MRHAFKFPKHIRNAVKWHIQRALLVMDVSRYQQEHSYTCALAGRLDGTAYEGPDGFVIFKSTVVTDRGRGSAEKKVGADLVITADISDNNKRIKKAILIQSKRGNIDELQPREKRNLFEQIDRMKHFTNSPKIMETPDTHGPAFPRVISGNVVRDGKVAKKYSLDNYFTQRVLTTLDGDTRPEFVESVQDSNMSKLLLLAKLKGENTV